MTATKHDKKKTIHRTFSRQGKFRNILRFLIWLAIERKAEITRLALYKTGKATATGRKTHDDEKRATTKKRTGRPRKKVSKRTRDETRKKQNRDAAQRYRARKKEQPK